MLNSQLSNNQSRPAALGPTAKASIDGKKQSHEDTKEDVSKLGERIIDSTENTETMRAEETLRCRLVVQR